MAMSPRELLQDDIDCRAIDWINFAMSRELSCGHYDRESVETAIRCAYAQGYTDALKEDPRGKLLLDHGYPVP